MALPILLCAAGALRFVMAYSQRRLIYPDEIFQVLEPAHRLVYGNGVLAWEYMVGMRNWLFPGVIAATMAAGRLLGPDPALEIVPTRLFLIAASLVPVWAAYRWGERLDGARGGLIVGGFVTAWVDLIYIAPHPLSDVIASDVLMAGLYAALPLTTKSSPLRLAAGGALFAIAAILRLQLAPALLVAAIFACGLSPRAWLALVMGGAPVLLASGLLDWLTLGTPFQSIWLNVWLNIVKGTSNDFGVQPPGFYLFAMLGYWRFAAAAILLGLLSGGRRFPALAAVAVTILLTQSLIAHKEWRFIFPALPPVITLCGVAALELAGDLRRALGKRTPSRAVLAATVLAAWAGLSLATGMSQGYRPAWTVRRELIDAFAQAARQPGLCGVDLVDIRWWTSPGSAALPPGTPIYATASADTLRFEPSFNAAVLDGASPPLAAPFRRAGCFDGTDDLEGRPGSTACLWIRPGACSLAQISPPQPNWPTYFRDGQGRPRQDRIRAYARQP